jgi:hypothetical protein
MNIQIGGATFTPRMPLIAAINRLTHAWYAALNLGRTAAGDVEQRGPIDPHMVSVVGAAIAAELLPAAERQRIGIGDLWSYPSVPAYGAAVMEAFERSKIATYAEVSERSIEYFETLRAVTLTDDDADDAADPT